MKVLSCARDSYFERNDEITSFRLDSFHKFLVLRQSDFRNFSTIYRYCHSLRFRPRGLENMSVDLDAVWLVRAGLWFFFPCSIKIQKDKVLHLLPDVAFDR